MQPARDVANSESSPIAGELVFAVDTGGTKTAAWLVEAFDGQPHRVLGQTRTAAGNPLSVGFDRATQAIGQALCDVLKQTSSIGPAKVHRAILSIAGAANRSTTERFVEWARTAALAAQVTIVSDVLPILAAGTPDCCGVALISGTGSSAFGRTADGRTKRSGGWGYLLGDEGSGYAIGRAALGRTLADLESYQQLRPLAEAVRTSLGVTSVTELTRTIYSNADPRHAIAAVAPVVLTAADSGDADAEEILGDAAIALAALVARNATELGLTDTRFPLAVSGGVLINSPRLRDELTTELTKLDLECELSVVSDPLVGCVRLAGPRFAGSLVTWHAL